MPDTLALQCKFLNDDAAKALAPIASELHCLFEQLTISISGQIVEQIGGGGCSYGRIVEMLSKSLSTDKRITNSQFGFGITNVASVSKCQQRGFAAGRRYPCRWVYSRGAQAVGERNLEPKELLAALGHGAVHAG